MGDLQRGSARGRQGKKIKEIRFRLTHILRFLLKAPGVLPLFGNALPLFGNPPL
jgi:hypothetical protein